jgi:intracellular sulfur oxidation DsrE/DsrF family protein
MTRLVRHALALTVLAASAPCALVAQDADAVLRQHANQPLIKSPSFPAPKDLTYKVSWDVNVGPEKPEGVPDGFRRPAGFLMQTDDNGVPRSNVRLAIIVYGTAARSLLDNAAYKQQAGADNASIALLEALHASGVRIIVCGEALLGRNIPRDRLLPFVEVATTATLARATLAMQGYATFAP